MHENDYLTEKAVLISVDTGEFDAKSSLDELKELAKTADVEVLSYSVQKRDSYDSATCIGSGKLEEIVDFGEKNEVNLLIFDHELTGTQIRNIEKITKIRTVDRTMLILDIFAKRALSSEGKLQVELAQQKYRLPRLSGLGTELSRLGAGIGTRGPGETKLESDRRHIRNRISFLESEVRELEKRRAMTRARRKKNNLVNIAVVGYTNAGKSTLLNILTESDVLAENKLFATLDPTTRGFTLPDGRNVLLTDTVGFIKRLPHQLVQAFKSTLEEAKNADLILLICDITSDEMDQQKLCCEAILSDLGCGDIPLITAYNKCDAFPNVPPDNKENAVFISAKTGMGLDSLIELVAKTLPPSSQRMNLLIPYQHTGFISRIREEGKIYGEKYVGEGIFLDALIDIKIIKEAKAFETSLPFSDSDSADDFEQDEKN